MENKIIKTQEFVNEVVNAFKKQGYEAQAENGKVIVKHKGVDFVVRAAHRPVCEEVNERGVRTTHRGIEFASDTTTWSVSRETDSYIQFIIDYEDYSGKHTAQGNFEVLEDDLDDYIEKLINELIAA